MQRKAQRRAFLLATRPRQFVSQYRNFNHFVGLLGANSMPETNNLEPYPPLSSRDRILFAAKRLFALNGYENTSTVAIAREAATSESQLMKHFGSKQGLLVAIFDRGWASIDER